MLREAYTDRIPRIIDPSAGDDAMPRAQSFVERRFEELDVDRSGEVTFSEFLFVLESWVEDAGAQEGAQ
jgi:hypothetical protein